MSDLITKATGGDKPIGPNATWWRIRFNELVEATLAHDSARLRGVVKDMRWPAALAANADTTSAQSIAAVAHAMGELARIAMQLVSSDEAVKNMVGTHAGSLIRELGREPRQSGVELGRSLGIDVTEVSRQTARLLANGLVARERRGKSVSWTLTRRGQAAYDAIAPVALDTTLRAEPVEATTDRPKDDRTQSVRQASIREYFFAHGSQLMVAAA
jgi:DNA-binding MarR family transcriptional regulator